MKIPRKKLVLALLTAVAAAVLHHFAFVSINGQYRELEAMNQWFRRRGERTPPKELLVVRLDEESYQRLGLSVLQPFPRKKLAELIRRLAEYKAAGVALDMNLVPKESHDDADKELAEALQLLPAVIGQWIDYNAGQNLHGDTEYWTQQNLSDPYFLGSSVKLGDVRIPLDNYISRRFKTGDEDPRPISEIAAGFVKKPTLFPSAVDFIDFYGPAGTIPSIPARLLLQPEEDLDTSLIHGKIVFIGLFLSAASSRLPHDAFSSPLSARIYGAEIHATAAGNLLEQRWIKRMSFFWEEVLLSMSVFLAAFAFFVLPPKQGALVCLSLFVLHLYGGYALFKYSFFLPGVNATFYVLPAFFVFGWFFNFLEAQKRRAILKDCLSRYLNPQMAQRIETQPSLMRPSVERRQIAVLFTDITRYTRLSETSEDGCTGELLNRYLPVIAECGMAEGGVVLKAAGDGGLIIWGAPLEIDAPCDRAVRTALAIEERLKAEIAAGRIPPLKTRFGVAFGMADVGNVGSENHFDYSAEGDTMNVAARLVNVSTKVGVSILVSDSFATQLARRENLFHLGAIRVKGRRTAVKVHAVFKSPIPDEVSGIWDEALQLFSQRKWEEAAAMFKKAGRLESRLKKAARIFGFQALAFKKREPFLRWAGELVLRTK